MTDHNALTPRRDGNVYLLRRLHLQRQELTLRLEACVLPDELLHQPPPLHQRLCLLCQSLVDYLSTGHFHLYPRLLRQLPVLAEGGLEVVAGLYLKTGQTTDLAMQFNDKYDTDPASLAEAGELTHDLARLGRVLFIRFELEDLLIEILHCGRRQAPA